MNYFTIKLSKLQIENLLGLCKSYLIKDENKYVLFHCVKDKCEIIAYQTGSVVIKGNDIYEKVKIKRAQANDAMERAKARQEASSQLAKDADREAPLPEDAEGFSEEPIEVETLQLSEKSDSSDTEVPAMESDSSAAEGGN